MNLFSSFYLPLLISVGLSFCQKVPIPEKVDQLTVLSYNIHHSNPPSLPDSIDLKAIAKVIIESEAEIVGLQEVDVFTKRSGSSIHMAKELAELAGFDYYYFSKGIDFQGGEYGTAIISKYPMSHTETIPLPGKEGTEPRTLSLATINIGKGKSLLFANTHMDFSSDSLALAQAKAITETLQSSELPLILMGDMNSTPESPAIQLFETFLEQSCPDFCPPTIPVINPKKTIDFILYKKGMGMNVVSHEVIPETYASDHLPVKAVFEIQY